MPLRPTVTRSAGEPVAGGNVSLRQCHHCGYNPGSDPGTQERRLRRCAGCMQAWYCSTQCQKAAWKAHKAECKEVMKENSSGDDSDAQSIGFSSISLFDQALREFEHAHNFAIRGLAKALVLRAGGNGWTQSPQRLLHFNLESVAALGAHRNPSRTFRLKGYAFATLQDLVATHPQVADDWAQTQPTRDQILDELARLPDGASARVEGILPVRFIVEGMDVSNLLFFPLFRAEAHADANAGERVVREAVLADMVDFLMGSINGGFPLHCVEGQHPLVALPGRFMRARGSWTWNALFGSWDEYRRGVHKDLDATLRRLFIMNEEPNKPMMLFGMW
ncbi:hypothetical protein C8Q80DRAFT_1242498 [Daedaleopsis nitida]|nr:hypothetical protein C8Q80DRAFT_1242498 [Daedaleopsis nitida]